MIKYVCIALALAAFSCKSKEVSAEDDFQYEEKKSPTEQGQTLFEGKGNCYACHNPERKIVGPSLVEIASVYKEKKGDMVAFLREKAEPIVDPNQYEAMRVNFAVTKRMSDAELEALEAYIMGFAK